MTYLSDVTQPRVRLLRLQLIVLVVYLADGLVCSFTPRPMPWVVLIPGCIPLVVAACIIAPMRRADARRRPAVQA